MSKRKVIGVLGDGTNSYAALSVPLGQLIAQRGFDLLTGGGGGVILMQLNLCTSTDEAKSIADVSKRF